MPTIESVTFDACGMTALGRENAGHTARGWQASDGDQITLNFSPAPTYRRISIDWMTYALAFGEYWNAGPGSD